MLRCLHAGVPSTLRTTRIALEIVNYYFVFLTPLPIMQLRNVFHTGMCIFFHNSGVLNPFQRVDVLKDEVSTDPLFPVFLAEHGEVVMLSVHRFEVYFFRIVQDRVIRTMTFGFM